MDKAKRLIMLLVVLIAICLPLASCGDDSLEIVFMVDGVEYQRVVTDGESEITLPSDPVKEGFEFVGWFLNEEKINEKTFIEDSYSGTVTVTATFVPHVHTEVTVKGYAPTCTVDGLSDGIKCTVCNEIIIAQEPIKAAGHTEEIFAAVAPTCTKTGLTEGKKCSVCDEVLVAQEVVPVKGHTEEILASVAPTCTKTGLTEGEKCSVCGDILVAQEVVPAKGHTEETLAAVAPTCTKTGLTEGKKCSVCGEVLVAQKIVSATGHTEAVITGYDATCTADGLTNGTRCTVCKEITKAQTVIKASGHKTVTIYGKAATCTDDGLTSGVKCTVCNEFTVSQEVIPARGHIERDIIGKDATCTEDGTTNGKSCRICLVVTVEQEVIPALGHSEITIAGRDATCTVNGFTDGVKCSRCKLTLVSQKVINAKGHTEVIVNGYAATCTNNGLTDGIACSACNEVIRAGVPIKALGHSKSKGYCTICNERIPSVGLALELRDDGYYVIGLGTCTDTEIIIPEEHNGTAVVGIGDQAFYDDKNYSSHITLVDIPDSVTYIGRSAFLHCNNLVYAKLPNKLAFIGESAFGYCESLVSISIESPLITTIPARLFNNCKRLESVALSDSISEIGSYAFYNCKLLSDINITASITTIGTYAFYDCESLISADLSSVKDISTYAFFGCKALCSLTLCEELTSIGISSFGLCEGLTEIHLPDSLKHIQGTAFYQCTNISGSVTIPEGVSTIGTGIFWGCTKITEIRYNAISPTCENYVFSNVGDPSVGVRVIIGKDVTVIPGYLFAKGSYNNISPNVISLEFEEGSKCTDIQNFAFYGCEPLKTVYLPSSIKSIGSSAFAGCTGMSYLYFSHTADWYDWDHSRYPVSENAFTNIGKNSDELTVVIGKDTTFIHNNTFYNTGITEVIFEEDSLCTRIGGLAFAYCYSLKSITFGEGIQTVGYYAFDKCTALTAVHARDLDAFCGINYTDLSDNISVVNEGSNPLYYAKTLYYNGAPVTELVISNNVTKIGCGAFYGCTSITSVYIPESVIEIGNFAFYGCTGLRSATFSVTSGWYEYDNAEDTTRGTQIFLPKKVGNTTIPNHRVLNELCVYYYWKRY